MPPSDRSVLPRPRPAAAACLAVTIALGLASRRWPLPGILAEHTGDALYTTAVFWALVLVAPGLAARTAGLVACLFSFLIEFGQALDADWLRELRANRWAALLLGQGFQIADLLAYAIGAGVAIGLDAWLFPGRPGANP